MTIRLARGIAVLLSAVAVAGCSDAAGPSVPSGMINATFTGYIAGTFSPSGAYDDRPTTTYAVAFDVPDTQTGALHIGGVQYVDGIGRSLVMTLSRATPGTYGFGESCDFDNAPCAYGRFLNDENIADNEDPHAYDIIAGSVVISDDSGGRMRGTFTLEVQRYDPVTGQLIPDRFATFSGGSFDVPVVARPLR